MRTLLGNGTSSKNSGSSFCRKSTCARPVRRFGNTAGPINWLSITPHHTFTEKRCWEFLSTMACGFLADDRCELLVLFMPSRVKPASSVNNMNGINWQLAINHRHKSNRLASSSSRRCTICRWKGYRPCWHKVRHTLLCGTPIRVEILRVLVVGVRSTDWRMLSTSSTFCSFVVNTSKHSLTLKSPN